MYCNRLIIRSATSQHRISGLKRTGPRKSGGESSHNGKLLPSISATAPWIVYDCRSCRVYALPSQFWKTREPLRALTWVFGSGPWFTWSQGFKAIPCSPKDMRCMANPRKCQRDACHIDSITSARAWIDNSSQDFGTRGQERQCDCKSSTLQVPLEE